jgi:hypothetical protein
MKRTLIAVATLIGLASAANAATLTVVADQPSYNVGDTITLTVTGDTTAGFSLLAFGRLLFDNPAVAAFSTGTPNQTAMLAFGSIPWVTGPLVCTSSSCEMMNQISPITATPANSSNLLVATVSFLATAPGTSNVAWDTNQAGGFQLDFFGLTNAPGTTITVAGAVVPEPTTAALLGMGLLGLAITGRRRA